MELLQLKYFQVIVKAGNISNAAKELCIAQPSLSQTLKRLEQEIGTPLFDRIGKKVILNDAGKIFLKYVDSALLSLDDAKSEINTLIKKEDKTVSISVQAASTLLPNILNQIHLYDSEIKLKILQESNSSNIHFDYCISSTATLPMDDTIILLEEPIVVAIPTTNPLSIKEEIHLSDLEPEEFISLTTEHILTSILQDFFTNKNFIPLNTIQVNSPNIMRDLLKINLGLAFVPANTWKNFESELIVYRHVKDFPMKRYITLTTSPGKYKTPSMLVCEKCIIDFFTKYSLQASAK